MGETVKKDDYARLHYAYHEDTDLAIIADQLDEEHGAGWLVWLYWPRMITRAKQAKAFGWFETTPRKLAATLHDPLTGDAWAARARMWELLVERGIVRVRQGAVTSSTAKLDVLLVQYEKWQSLSNAESSKLKRERNRVAAGEQPHWTVAHWSDFKTEIANKDKRRDKGADLISGVRDNETGSRDNETGSRDNENAVRDTPLDKTRQDETRQDKQDTSPKAPQADAARRLFDHWLTATGRNPNQNRLTTKRRRMVKGRLSDGYTEEQLHAAIDGIASSPWHRGENPSGTRYDTFQFVFRDGENVEKGLERAAADAARAAAGTPVQPIRGSSPRHAISEEYDDGIQWHDNQNPAA